MVLLVESDMVGGPPGVEEGPGAPTSLFFCRLSSLLFFLISAKTSSRFLLDSSASIAFLKPFFLVSVLVPGLSDILRLFPSFDACAEDLPSLGLPLRSSLARRARVEVRGASTWTHVAHTSHVRSAAPCLVHHHGRLHLFPLRIFGICGERRGEPSFCEYSVGEGGEGEG